MANLKGDLSRIIPEEDIPNFDKFEIPPMAGPDGMFTKAQRFVLQLYVAKWIQLVESEPTSLSETSWKSQALDEIYKSKPFQQLDPSKSLAEYDKVSER